MPMFDATDLLNDPNAMGLFGALAGAAGANRVSTMPIPKFATLAGLLGGAAGGAETALGNQLKTQQIKGAGLANTGADLANQMTGLNLEGFKRFAAQLGGNAVPPTNKGALIADASGGGATGAPGGAPDFAGALRAAAQGGMAPGPTNAMTATADTPRAAFGAPSSAPSPDGTFDPASMQRLMPSMMGFPAGMSMMAPLLQYLEKITPAGARVNASGGIDPRTGYYDYLQASKLHEALGTGQQQLDPNSGVISNLPGAVESAAAKAGQVKTNETLGANLQTRDANGNVINMPGAVASAATKEGAVKGAGAQAEADVRMNTTIQTAEDPNSGAPVQKTLGQAIQDAKNGGKMQTLTDPTDQLGKGDMLSATGTIVPAPPPQAKASLTPSAGSGVVAGQTAQAKVDQAAVAKYDPEVADRYTKNEQSIQRFSSAIEALKMVESGAWTEDIAKFNGMLRAVGVPPDKIPALIANKDPAQVQVVLKEAMTAVATSLQQYFPRATQFEFKTMLNTVMSPDFQPAANKKILSELMGNLYQDQNMIRDWMGPAKQIGWRSPSQYEVQWQQKNPMKGFVDYASRSIGSLKGMPSGSLSYQEGPNGEEGWMFPKNDGSGYYIGDFNGQSLAPGQKAKK